MNRIIKLLFLSTIALLSLASCAKESLIMVTGVSLSPESFELEVGEEKVLTAKITPNDATQRALVFSSSKSSVATVSDDGIVKAIAIGTAIMTVTTKDGGYKDHCTVNVVRKAIHLTGISLNETSLSLREGNEFTLVPVFTPENAKNKSVRWTSDNEAVATVSSDGVVKAIKAGNAIVTATTEDQGKTATCMVGVVEGIGVIIGDATHISCRNAIIAGKAKTTSIISKDLSFGVYYSTSPDVPISSAKQVKAAKFDSDYNFVIDREVFEAETIYYYKSFIVQSGEVQYGEVKSFKTLPMSSMIQTGGEKYIYPQEAVLTATLDLTDCKYDKLEYGFVITPEGGQPQTLRASGHSGNSFSFKADSLRPDTGYSYAAYVTLDGRTYNGEVRTFITPTIQGTITADVSNLSFYSATISGKLQIATWGTFKNKSAAIYYSDSVCSLEELKSKGTMKTLTLYENGYYSINLKLRSDTPYHFVVVINVDGMELCSEVKGFNTLKVQEIVDLGLSVKWRSWNIGASRPEDYGSNFAYGDVVGQTWDGYSWSGGGFFSAPAREVDENQNLTLAYDAAHVILGMPWRMPTKAELIELCNNCKVSWTRDYNGTGVMGLIFTSCITGYEDKSIFLPSAWRGVRNIVENLRYYCCYRASTFGVDERGYYLYYNGGLFFSVDSVYGYSIRPVRDY